MRRRFGYDAWYAGGLHVRGVTVQRSVREAVVFLLSRPFRVVEVFDGAERVGVWWESVNP